MDNKKFTSEQKTNIEVTDLKPGMKLASNIELEYGGIIIPAGTILDQEKIMRLRNMGNKFVYIYDEDEDTIADNYKKISNTEVKYQKSIDQAGKLYKQARNNEEIDLEEVKKLTFEVTTFGNDEEMINLLTSIREADRYTYIHLINVGMLAYLFGNWIGLSEDKQLEITQAGLLHDIGKAFISDEILKKSADLTEEEYQKVKQHCIFGYKLVEKKEEISEEISRAILTHHERYNGTGYPLELSGENIPLYGRMLAIIDTFDAMTAERPYQKSSSPFTAMRLFQEETFGKFDIELLNIFLDNIPFYFVNEEVLLNDGREALIIHINPRYPDKPIIKVEDDYIDLVVNRDIEIARLIEA